MLEFLRANWNRLKEGRPGQRFCALYEQRQRDRQTMSRFGRSLPVVLGIILVLGGLAIGWLPGPGGPSLAPAGTMTSAAGSVRRELRLAIVAWRAVLVAADDDQSNRCEGERGAFQRDTAESECVRTPFDSIWSIR